MPQPLCAKWVGKVLVDDVWSGGSKDGKSNVTGVKYKTVSQAIKEGLYHPRCRDSHTTYFEGINTMPAEGYTKEELKKLAEDYKGEQQQQYAERQAESYNRLAKYSLDKDNQRIYRARAEEWENRKRLYQKDRGKKILVTEQAINKVRLVNINELTTKNNETVQTIHKKILKFTKDENNSDEVACLINLTTNETSKIIKGDSHSVDIYSDPDVYHDLRKSGKNSLMICHNHPGLTDFSANDINLFMKHDSVKVMTIVTNQGKVRYISKNKKFSYEKAVKLMKSCFDNNSNDIEKSIEEF